MLGGKYIDAKGNVKLAPKVGDNPIKVTHYSYENCDKKEIEICINCDSEECFGECKKIRDYRKSKLSR